MPYKPEPYEPKHICPKCQKITPAPEGDFCADCNVPLDHYNPDRERPIDDFGGAGTYLIAALVPIVGIILGLIYVARGEDKKGKSCIWTSIITSAVVGVIWYAIVSAAWR